MKRYFLLAGFFTILSFGCVSNGSDADDKPNILVVLLDDMGFSDIGCYGGEIHTPTIDRLAAEGLRFGYMHNNAKCESSRPSLLSGHYCNQSGRQSLRNSATIADVAGSEEYYTFITGKWHLDDHPMDRGFDRFYGMLEGACDYFTGNGYFLVDRDKFDVPDDFYATDYIMDYSLRFIEEAKENDQPFLGYIAFNAPHSPLHAPREDVEKYYDTYKAGWDKLRNARYEKMLNEGVIRENAKLSPSPDFIDAWDDLTKEEKAFEIYRMATYAACIDIVDQNMAKLVDYLEENEMLDNTVIMFMSDNGASPFERMRGIEHFSWESEARYRQGASWAWMSNTPFRWFKQNQHEGGISTPFIVHYPNGINKELNGKVNHELTHFIDVMPTVVDLIGAEYPSEIRNHAVLPVEGISLVNAFAGEVLESREYLYQQWNTNRALFMDGYKISSFRANDWELYNIDKDRSELNNLADEKPELLKEMVETWRDIAINKDHAPEDMLYELPAEELAEDWGVRNWHDNLDEKTVSDFYKYVYSRLNYDLGD